uniref:Uncharacterized protein n=1 Tax=Rhizophora mucronata TaxID=61149 RepID=A0A2P2KK80_RHIMU
MVLVVEKRLFSTCVFNKERGKQRQGGGNGCAEACGVKIEDRPIICKVVWICNRAILRM